MKGTPLVVLAFVGIFIAGALTGGVLTVQWLQVREWRHGQHGPPMGPRQFQRPPAQPGQFNVQLMARFTRQLDLTPDQVNAITPLVRDASEKLRRLRSETAHSTELILNQVEDQISAVLTPAQHDKFAALIQAQRDRLQKYNREQQQRHWEQQYQQQPQNQPPPQP